MRSSEAVCGGSYLKCAQTWNVIKSPATAITTASFTLDASILTWVVV